MVDAQTNVGANAAAYQSANLSKHTHPSRLYRYLNERFLRALTGLAAQAAPRVILEVGCGEGFVLQTLWQSGAGHPLLGCDRSAGAVRYARQMLPSTVVLLVADVNYLPFATHSVDLVICSEVLEHLADPDAALSEFTRLSRRAVLLSVPREPWFRMLAALATWLKLGRDPGHVQFWTRGGFARLVRRHFADVYITTSSIYRLSLAHVS